MWMAGRFSRRIRGCAKAHGIPVIDCSAGQRKHDLAEEYLAKDDGHPGLVSGPSWSSPGAGVGCQRKAPHRTKKADALFQHYSFHILDSDWGHLTIKISGHPPFPAQVILNGHEYVACQARKAGIALTRKETALPLSLTPQVWRRSQRPCPSTGL